MPLAPAVLSPRGSDGPRRRCGCDVEVPRRRDAATSRGDADVRSRPATRLRYAICVCALIYSGAMTDGCRVVLTEAYKLQSLLPGPLAKRWRLVVTLALHMLPGLDPKEDPYLTGKYEPPEAGPRSGKDGVLVTGTSGA